MVMDTTVSTTQQYAGILSSFTEYYWRVHASSSNGTGNWSAVYSFTTNGIGVLPGPPRYRSVSLGYSGTLTVYSLSGRLVLKVPFGSSATREEVLDLVNKIPSRGKELYSYRFLMIEK